MEHKYWIQPTATVLMLIVVFDGGATCGSTPSDSSTDTREPTGEGSSVVDSDWALFRGDSSSTGVSPFCLPEDLSLLWTFEVEEGAFEATAAIVDGVVFLGDLDGKFLDLEKSYQFRYGFFFAVVFCKAKTYLVKSKKYTV